MDQDNLQRRRLVGVKSSKGFLWPRGMSFAPGGEIRIKARTRIWRIACVCVRVNLLSLGRWWTLALKSALWAGWFAGGPFWLHLWRQTWVTEGKKKRERQAVCFTGKDKVWKLMWVTSVNVLGKLHKVLLGDTAADTVKCDLQFFCCCQVY